MVGDVAHLSQMTILAITGFIKHFYHNRVHLLKAHDPQKTLLVLIAETLRFLVVGRFLSRTEEPAKAGTCARDRRVLQQLALKVHVKHSDLT